MSVNLLFKIKNFNNNSENFICILAHFNSKIKYLSYKLKYPEAETDLIIYFYELIGKLNKNKFIEDEELIMYINKCLKNKSIYLSNKQNKDKQYLCFTSEAEILDVFNYVEMKDEYSDIRFNDLISSLNKRQKEIMFYKFYMQLSDIEIGKILKISRQTVNKTQKRALKNLKDKLLM
ncbi:sigma-70 family RNA polymerase sigma factor [Clostridium sp. YIM B02555]|uniref:sigma-70 family RNA polymerase sigma factor n=1 Tax=Clostridium sp. YIM B02555 TaxID=2911968 RepID=UPI001EEDA541|nr:sigma-70 family RNA polymerase sigma factor [Clostridium sp. YIM B02555]